MTLPLNLNTASPLSTLDSPSSASSAGGTYTDINGLEALKKDPNSPQALGKVAQQVEAMFLQMMLKSMRDASLGDGIFDSQEGKMYQDMFDKQIALNMSQHQNVGISDLLMRQLSQKSSPAGPPASTGIRGASSAQPAAADPAKFVAQVLPSIERAAKRIGVSPAGMLAQAALETGWGQRVVQGADGASSNNLFGVKAGQAWTGARAHADTLEYDGTVATRRKESFRAYGSIEDSVNDFAQLLSTSPRYRDAISAGSDAHAYARAVGESGYATDPEYTNKLNQILKSDTLRAALAPRMAALQK